MKFFQQKEKCPSRYSNGEIWLSDKLWEHSQFQSRFSVRIPVWTFFCPVGKIAISFYEYIMFDYSLKGFVIGLLNIYIFSKPIAYLNRILRHNDISESNIWCNFKIFIYKLLRHLKINIYYYFFSTHSEIYSLELKNALSLYS